MSYLFLHLYQFNPLRLMRNLLAVLHPRWKPSFFLFSLIINNYQIKYIHFWKLDVQLILSSFYLLHKKWSFPLRISAINVTKSGVFCRFGHIYWRNLSWKTSFFVQWQLIMSDFLTVISHRQTLDLNPHWLSSYCNNMESLTK